MNIVKNSNKISTLIILQNRFYIAVKLQRPGACISHQQCVGRRAFMNIVKTVIKYLIDKSAKQYRSYITVRLGCNSNTHHADAIYMHLFKLFIDRIDIHINMYYIEFNSSTRNVGELAEW